MIYNAYTQDPGGFPANLPSTDGAGLVVIQGSSVGIQVQDENPARLQHPFDGVAKRWHAGDGLEHQDGMIVGLLPISQLPAVASLTPTERSRRR